MHLLTAITPHGFGHAAQVAPVLNALRRKLPGLELTLLTTVPKAFLQGRIEGEFRLIEAAPDFGLVMHSAIAIDVDASAAAYRDLHSDWNSYLAREVERLQGLAPDLVLADVPYLTLAAAAAADIPALALCSLNWADIYRHYFAGRPEAAQVLACMETAYRGARAFVCPEPAMPMPFLDNRIDVGPIAVQGRAEPEELRARLPASAAGTRVILVAPGGVQTRFPIEDWPTGRGIHWLVSADWQVAHPDASSYQDTGLSFTDLVASCDAVLGKCGYGTVTECVANATPLMYIPRPDWPEEATLLNWLDAHGAALAVAPQWLENGCFGDLMASLDALQITACRPDGAEQAAGLLAGYLCE